MIWYFIIGVVVGGLPLVVPAVRDLIVGENATDTAFIAVVSALFITAAVAGWPVAVTAWVVWLAIRQKAREAK